MNHYFFPCEGWEPVATIHSDDHLWPILAVWNLIAESGELSFLEEKIGYYDGGEATVFEHLRRSVDYTCTHLGAHGFPLMLRSDWNDQLFKVCRRGKGESIWTAMQFGLALQKMAELADRKGLSELAASYKKLYEDQKKLVNTTGWDGQWFRRAIMDDGRFLGTDEHDQAKIWLNAQTWSILSGIAEPQKAVAAMDSVKKMLDTPLGIKKIHPSITDFPDPKDPLTNYNPGTGENGSVFCHANTWAVIAECLLGRGDLAWKYYHQLIPAVVMKNAGIQRYKAEPYVYASNLFGPESDKFGFANVSWLTGTAAWMYVAATQYILGVRPVMDGLLIDPCIPPDWKDVRVTRDFRGCRYDIEIVNSSGACKGVKYLTVDGKPSDSHIVLHRNGQSVVKVRAVLS